MDSPNTAVVLYKYRRFQHLVVQQPTKFESSLAMVQKTSKFVSLLALGLLPCFLLNAAALEKRFTDAPMTFAVFGYVRLNKTAVR